MNKAKVLIYDIEVGPNIIYAWSQGRKYDINLLEIKKEWEILSVSYKWFGEDKIHTLSQGQLGNERRLVKKFYKIISEADVVIAHNGKEFDNKKTNTKFIKYNVFSPPTYEAIDTLKEVRKYFAFDGNSLDDICKFFGFGRKKRTPGLDMWLGCLNGNQRHWRLMEEYNRHDIYLLDKVYKKIQNWIKSHPRINFGDGCPTCGSLKLESNGYRRTKTMIYKRYRCTGCGKSLRSTTSEGGRPKIVGL